ncbi:MAG: hypothetical protein ABFR62_11090 [Bacteroidota bacterium]
MTYEYPIWYILLSVLIAVVLSYLLYRKNIKTSWKFIFMAFLRFLALLIILLAIGKLSISSTIENKSKSKLILAFDTSESMIFNEDESKLNEIYFNLKESELSNGYNIKSLGFGEAVSEADTLRFNQKVSNFQDLEENLDLILDEGDKVILISDGNVNEGNSAVFKREKKYSINIIGVGDTALTSKVNLSKLHFNKRVVAGNNFPVEIFYEIENIDQPIILKVLDGDRIIYSEKIIHHQNSEIKQSHRHSIFLKSDKSGNRQFKIELSSPGELKVFTEKYFNIEFVTDKGKVLINYDFPHPDISLFKRELVERNYRVFLSKKTISIDSVNKYDFVVDFGEKTIEGIEVPVIIVSSKKINRIGETKNLSGDVAYANIDQDYLKSIELLEDKKAIIIQLNELWKFNLQEAGNDKEIVGAFFETLIKEVELLKFIDKFNIVYKDRYSDREDIKIKLVNTYSVVKSVEAFAKINIDGNNKNIDFIKDQNEYYLNLGQLPKGKYSLKVYINKKYFDTINLAVDDINIEKFAKKQNIEFLKDIASLQGGEYYNTGNFDSLIEKLKGGVESVLYTNKEFRNILEQWYFFLLLPLILGAEWLLRRRNGLY